MENWKDLYTELATLCNDNITDINWIDLWHNQVNFLEQEYPFTGPAVFFAFRTLPVEDNGKLMQNVGVQVDAYLFYETFSDTYHGSYNQGTALDFLDLLTELKKLLHGAHGDNFIEMRWVSMTAVDTGSAHNLYRHSFVCVVNDESAYKAGEDIVDEDGNPVTETEWQEYHMDE